MSYNIKKSVCVVGGGNWGKNHIKTLSKLSSLEELLKEILVY